MRMILDNIRVILSVIVLLDTFLMNITDFAQGATIRLLDFGQTPLPYRHRLLSLGLTKGVSVTITRVAPLGCPVQIEVRGTALALRSEDAKFLQWESL